MLTSSGRSPAPGASTAAIGVRRLTDIITGAGVLVGLGSPIPKLPPKRNAMRPTKSRVTASPDPMATHIHVLVGDRIAPAASPVFAGSDPPVLGGDPVIARPQSLQNPALSSFSDPQSLQYIRSASEIQDNRRGPGLVPLRHQLRHAHVTGLRLAETRLAADHSGAYRPDLTALHLNS